MLAHDVVDCTGADYFDDDSSTDSVESQQSTTAGGSVLLAVGHKTAHVQSGTSPQAFVQPSMDMPVAVGMVRARRSLGRRHNPVQEHPGEL